MRAGVLNLPKERFDRIIAVSDLHGYDKTFERLLKTTGFSERDALVLMGDYIERGPSCLQLLHRIMELNCHENVFVLAGNCDNLLEEVFESRYRGDIIRYLKNNSHTIVHEMLAERCRPFSDCTAPEDIQDLISRYYARERMFLASLPHIADAGKFVFVHAGLDPVPVSEQNSDRCLKRRNFHEEMSVFPFMLVVGHLPLQLIRCDGNCEPVFESDRNIWWIDGGVGIFPGSYMNALAICSDGQDRIYSAATDNN